MNDRPYRTWDIFGGALGKVRQESPLGARCAFEDIDTSARGERPCYVKCSRPVEFVWHKPDDRKVCYCRKHAFNGVHPELHNPPDRVEEQ